MTTKQIIKEITNGLPIEVVLKNEEIRSWDEPRRKGQGSYDLKSLCEAGYTDAGLVRRFADFLPYTDRQIESIEKKLSGSVPAEGEICSCCGKPAEAFGNDGAFCKFCGQKFEKETDVCIGENMKRKRLESGMTLRQVEDLSKTNIAKLSQMETGKKLPGIDLLEKLAYIYKCSINELMGLPELRSDLEPVEPVEDDEVYYCPCCDNVVDLSIGEALSIDLQTYQEVKTESEGNDGHFCKYCGQAIIRPVEMDTDEMFRSYRFWIERAARKAAKRKI